MTKQNTIRAGSMGLILLAACAAGLVALKHLAGIEFPPWARVVILLTVMSLAVGATWSWWNALDEVAREAHKFAWYWGGSIGMAVAGVVLILVDSQQMAPPHIVPGEHGDFALGAMTVMLAQIVGYLIAWAGWWWSRR